MRRFMLYKSKITEKIFDQFSVDNFYVSWRHVYKNVGVWEIEKVVFFEISFYRNNLEVLNNKSARGNQNLPEKTVSFQKMSQKITLKSEFFNFYDYLSGLGMKITPDPDFSSNFNPRGVFLTKIFWVFKKIRFYVLGDTPPLNSVKKF